MSIEREIDRGAKAKALLNDPLYREAVDKVRQGILDRFSNAPLADKEGIYTLRLMLKVLNDIEGNITEVAQTGKLAEIQLEQEKEKELSWGKLFNFGVRK